MPTTNEPTVPVPVSLTEQQIRDAIDTAYNERCSHILLPLTDHEWTGIVHVAAESVFALLSQSTPTAEPRAIEKGMRVRYIDGGDKRIVGDFTDGAWDLVIPGTEKSRMCVEPEVFWQTVEPVPAPSSIADMVPGTTFWLEGLSGMFMRTTYGAVHTSGVATSGLTIDPSTIRDVTPAAGA